MSWNWPSSLSIAMNWPDDDLTDDEIDEMIERIRQHQEDRDYFETH